MIFFQKNNDAVSSTIGYLLYSSLFILFFVIINLSVSNYLHEYPSNIIIEDEFSDIGNMMSTYITDIYLLAPENGRIDTYYMLPITVGHEYYKINANIVLTDQILEVESLSSHRKGSVTLGGIAATIPINGTSISTEAEHRISYDSRR